MGRRAFEDVDNRNGGQGVMTLKERNTALENEVEHLTRLNDTNMAYIRELHSLLLPILKERYNENKGNERNILDKDRARHDIRAL